MRGVWERLIAELDPDHDPLPGAAEMATAALDGGLAAPLPGLGILHVAGDDAGAFLHNQLTQAVDGLPADQTCLAAWCNAKGRAHAVLRVVPSDTGLVLIGDAAVIEAIRPKLQRFILRAQVALTDISDSEGLLGLAGPVAESLLEETAGSLPRSDNALVRAGDLHVIRIPGGETRRYLLLAPAEQLGALWQRYCLSLTRADEAFWQLLDIRAGLPQITAATMEAFVPTMLNLEPLGGISYEKGCYPGQEVVARMHYLGRLKRRLYRARLADDPPPPGTSVNDDRGNEAGTVVTAALAPTGGSELLAVLRIDAANAGQLDVDGSPLALLDLPYPPPGEPTEAPPSA